MRRSFPTSRLPVTNLANFLEARFGTANEALADALITSALATIRPEFGGGEGPAPLGPARYTVARKILVNGTKISVELSDL